MDSSKQKKLLDLIASDARFREEELAAMLGESVEEIRNTLKELEEKHIICGYHTLINWDKVHDEDVTAMVELRVMPQGGDGYERLAEKIAGFPQVDTLYLMSGTYDFLVTVRGRSLKEVALFVNSKLAVIDEVQSTTTHFTLTKYKELGQNLQGFKTDARMLMTP
ncbi:MAG: Lrp/AsnC family transcriptional regulator [Clostridia bacterium]|nr:Lrp/AsnC family transcriptional regulator [Clostridia bacterium]